MIDVRRNEVMRVTGLGVMRDWREGIMQWPDVRKAYPDKWLIIEAIEAHSAENRRLLDRIAVVETCRDGADAMQCYRRLHQQYPEREFYFVHTSREELDIRETHWVGLWRGNAVSVTR